VHIYTKRDNIKRFGGGLAYSVIKLMILWGSNFWISHRKEKSPLTQGLNYMYRSACNRYKTPNCVTQFCFSSVLVLDTA